jgi:UDP:flavonoid glycosyltransferase YjiC (YdhE family)
MRALFTTQPSTGGFRPLVPLAHALVDAGHEVAFACSPSFRPHVEAAGFEMFPAGIDWVVAEMARAFPEAPPPGPARMAWIPTLWHLITARATVPDLLAIADRWEPDVFVRGSSESGACLAAEILGRPHAVAGAIWFRSLESNTEPYNEARRAVGLSPDPKMVSFYQYLTLPTMPPSWIAPDESLPPTAHFINPQPADESVTTEAPWPGGLQDRPLIHATLGTTEVNRTLGLYEAIISGLRDEPGTLIVAVGDQRDPADFGPQPSNVRIERYVDHGSLLPRCDVVLTHGGHGTLMACLSLGVPMVVLPVNADQPRNARRCADLGLARVVGPEERTPEAIRAATQAVLRDPSYRVNAQRVRDEIAAMPGLELAVELLERLARDRAPIIAAR